MNLIEYYRSNTCSSVVIIWIINVLIWEVVVARKLIGRLFFNKRIWNGINACGCVSRTLLHFRFRFFFLLLLNSFDSRCALLDKMYTYKQGDAFLMNGDLQFTIFLQIIDWFFLQKCFRAKKVVRTEQSKLRQKFLNIYGKNCLNVDRWSLIAISVLFHETESFLHSYRKFLKNHY